MNKSELIDAIAADEVCLRLMLVRRWMLRYLP